MKKRGASSSYISVIVSFFLTFAVLHLITHVIIFGTGIPGILTFGLQMTALDNVRNSIQSLSSYSLRTLTIEAILFIIYSFWFVFSKYKKVPAEQTIEQSKNPESPAQQEPAQEPEKKEQLKIPVEIKDKSRIKTDIDSLYNLLKENKRLSFDNIEKAFGVNKDTVASWAKILESGNLALIYQPKFGEPELWLDEKK